MLQHSGGHPCVETFPRIPLRQIAAITYTQNHRMVGAGRVLCGSSSPTLLPKQGHLHLLCLKFNKYHLWPTEEILPISLRVLIRKTERDFLPRPVMTGQWAMVFS